jgi:hypothetical protein
MSRFCGDIRQIAFVVRDADAAMHHWAKTQGVGPFLVRRDVEFDSFHYLGKPSRSPVLTIGMAHSGPLQIEIIQQHNDVPSAYRDFLNHMPEGFQHVCSWFDSRPAYKAGYQRLVDAGLECVHEGTGKGLDIRLAYFRSPENPYWPHFEIAEALRPEVANRIESLQGLAQGWDGKDPIREISAFPK